MLHFIIFFVFLPINSNSQKLYLFNKEKKNSMYIFKGSTKDSECSIK